MKVFVFGICFIFDGIRLSAGGWVAPQYIPPIIWPKDILVCASDKVYGKEIDCLSGERINILEESVGFEKGKCGYTDEANTNILATTFKEDCANMETCVLKIPLDDEDFNTLVENQSPSLHLFISYTCDIDGGFSEWGHWNACNTPCGTGLRNRTRSCDSPPPKNRGNSCSGVNSEEETCESNSSCKGWSGWSYWSICSGAGRSRQRTCGNPSGRRECRGDSTEWQCCRGNKFVTNPVQEESDVIDKVLAKDISLISCTLKCKLHQDCQQAGWLSTNKQQKTGPCYSLAPKNRIDGEVTVMPDGIIKIDSVVSGACKQPANTPF